MAVFPTASHWKNILLHFKDAVKMIQDDREKCGQPGKSRFFILNNQHRKMRSISRAKLLNFEEIFRFDLWTLGQQEAISFQMFISFAKPKSNCFNRKTNVKRISFISHFSILGIVYNRARAGTIILNLLYCITSF